MILGSSLGAVVGIVILAQTLYAATVERLSEYATLAAIGAGPGYLNAIVIKQALICGGAGYVLAILIALLITSAAHSSPVALTMSPGLVLMIGIGAAVMSPYQPFWPSADLLRSIRPVSSGSIWGRGMDIVRIRSSRILIGSGIVAAFLMVGAVLTRNDPGQASVSPSGFTVPSQSTLPRSGIVAALGVVEPRAGLVDLAPAMPGILAAVHVAEGSSVRRGDVVAELANEDLKAKVGQAEAVLAVRRSHLELIVLGPRQDEIHKAEAQLQEEGANMTWLRQQFERRQALFQKRLGLPGSLQ